METVNFLGVPLAPKTRGQVLELIQRTVSGHGRLPIGVVNAAKMVRMRRDRLLHADVLSSDIILADGSAVVWASRLLGRPLPERVAGIDLMMAMLQMGERNGYSFYLLGATEEVSRTVASRLAEKYPRVRVAGRRNGYFSADQEAGIAEDIRHAAPDVLLIAMSSPKKERFLSRWSRHIAVPVCHGVGGAFDVFAGKVKRAPGRWQRLGLEWFYRLLQEPRRLCGRYLLTNSLFCWMVLNELLRSRACRDPKYDLDSHSGGALIRRQG
jgi:N-acetylglucosaminyldiphosphoundecaprenol N-acetyl-beta-D-mannosaminyltransferase